MQFLWKILKNELSAINGLCEYLFQIYMYITNGTKGLVIFHIEVSSIVVEVENLYNLLCSLVVGFNF